jgi:hypothetical protein
VVGVAKVAGDSQRAGRPLFGFVELVDELFGEGEVAAVERRIERDELAPCHFGPGECAQFGGIDDGGAPEHLARFGQRRKFGARAQLRGEPVDRQREPISVEPLVGHDPADDGDVGG